MGGELRRKSPDELLREIQAEEPKPRRGYLKIFLGYASGVGKSFRMLDEARRRRERGQDVVIGAMQSKAAPEVEALAQKLEIIPLKRWTMARPSMWLPSSGVTRRFASLTDSPTTIRPDRSTRSGGKTFRNC